MQSIHSIHSLRSLRSLCRLDPIRRLSTTLQAPTVSPVSHVSSTLDAPPVRPLRALIIGAPGAGKGTLTQRMAAEFSLKTLSSGDLLRANVANKTPAGLKAKAIMDEGGLVHDAIINDVVLNELATLSDNQSFVLDGFPRTVSQAEMLDIWMQSRYGKSLDMVINLDVPWEVILGRINDRWIHAPSGRTYNLSYNPPLTVGIDDVTGEPLTKRSDDNAETVYARLEAYRKQTMPIIDHYDEEGIVYNFKGSTSNEIYPQICKVLREYFSSSPLTAAGASAKQESVTVGTE